MPPEQYSGRAADSRSDQFSFCAALYEALYKKLPFAGTDLAELAANVVHGRLQPIQQQGPIPSQIEQALRRGLSADPEQRFPSMTELLAALSLEVQHDPAGAPVARRLFTGSMAALILLIAVGVNLTRWRGGLTPRAYITAAAVLLVGATIAAVMLRPALRHNSFHRALVRLVLTLSAHLFALRVLGVSLHMEIEHLAVLDMLAVTAMLALTSAQHLPILWPVSVASGLATIAVALRPELVWTLLPLTYNVSGILFVLAWNRAARRLRPRSGSAAGSATISGTGTSSPSGGRSASKRQDAS